MLVAMLLWQSIFSFLQIATNAQQNKINTTSPFHRKLKTVAHNNTQVQNVPEAIHRNISKISLVALDTRTNYSRNQTTRNQSDVQTQIKKLQEELGKLKSKVSRKSMYCDFLPTDVCGKCSCINDVRLPKKYYCDCRYLDAQQDCLEFKQNGYKNDGIYKITGSAYRAVEVFCDQTTDGGGWTVFQRRFDGTLSFHRDWEMYKVGFGDLQFEHWLGNEHVHKLLLHSLYYQGTELRVDLMDWNRNRKYAKYSQFQVDSEFAKYELHVGGYSGTAGNAFAPHNKLSFTTIDQDNDLAGGNCAQKYTGGWWYTGTSCIGGAMINQNYYQLGTSVPSWYGIIWSTMNSASTSLKRTEMKFRRIV